MFYVAEWDTLVDDKSVFFSWVMFYNFTGGSPTSLDFTFDPPKDAGASAELTDDGSLEGAAENPPQG